MRSSTQLYVFGKTAGETTVYATDKAGRVVYAANVRVGLSVPQVATTLSCLFFMFALNSVMNGKILAFKRKRGRPPKNPQAAQQGGRREKTNLCL